MSSDLYSVDGQSGPVGCVNAFGLSELAHSGKLEGMRIRALNSGALLTEDEVRGIVQSVQLPPPVLRAPVQHIPVDGNQDPLRFVAPIHSSGWAIVASYLGLFSLLLIFAPFSLWAGLMALKDLKANPHKTGKGRAIFGIVMGAVFSLVLIGAIGSYLSSR